MKTPLHLSFDNTQYAFAYKSDSALRKSYRLFSIMQYGFLVKIGSALAPIALKLKLPIKGIIRNTIFEQFCGGENLQEVVQTAASLNEFSVDCALDYGVEASAGESNYNNSVKENQKAIEYAKTHPNIPMVSIKISGYARTRLLEKYDTEEPLTKEEQQEWKRVCHRIKNICQTAYDHQTIVLIDAEESWIQKAVDTIAYQMMTLFNKESVVVFNTFQLYRRDRLDTLKKQWQKSRANNYLLGAKLVRGAYMEKERDKAEEKGYSSPIQPDKAATDEDYNKAITWCLEHLDTVALFIGTHNEKSCMHAAQYMHDHQIPYDQPNVYFSQLYGMSDNITFNLAKAGYKTLKFLPYGPIKDTLPYLIRRSKENSAISGQMGRELHLLKKEIQRRKKSKETT